MKRDSNFTLEKRYSTADIVEEAFEGDVLEELLTPETEAILAQLMNLSTDYSCHGCAF